jgi:hypothetical protein
VKFQDPQRAGILWKFCAISDEWGTFNQLRLGEIGIPSRLRDTSDSSALGNSN